MTKEEWLNRYKARMIERGLNRKAAVDAALAVNFDLFCIFGLEDNPEDAADEELGYWVSDG